MRGERGNGRLGLLVWVVLMAGGIFLASRTIPTRVAVLNLHDFCDEQARYAAVSSRIDERQVIKEILERAEELEVPLTRKQLRFEEKKNTVRLYIKHSVTVDLEFYEWTWHYDRHFEHIKI